MVVSGNVFLLQTRLGPYKPDLFDSFGNSNAFNTVLT